MESWTDIRSMNMEELTAAVEAAGEKKFRAKQIYGWLHQKLIRSGSVQGEDSPGASAVRRDGGGTVRIQN